MEIVNCVPHVTICNLLNAYKFIGAVKYNQRLF